MSAGVLVKEVYKSYGQAHVLKGVSLEISAGSQCVITGASGSGKSTLLYLMGGLDHADQGSLTVGELDLAGCNDEQLADYRNQMVGFVFQFHFLLPSMNSLSNILLPARIGGQDVKVVERRCKEMADRLGVLACMDKFPFQLSGGEQQRINLIRALSLNPRLILCDEPTGNLDSENTQKVIELLRELASANQSTLVVVTHDQAVASAFENRFDLVDGKFGLSDGR